MGEEEQQQQLSSESECRRLFDQGVVTGEFSKMLFKPSGNWYALQPRVLDFSMGGDGGDDNDDDGGGGAGTLYAFLNVLRAVGDVVGSVAEGRERPVLDLPNVRGTLAVCSVSLGRLELVLVEVALMLGGSRLNDILF